MKRILVFLFLFVLPLVPILSLSQTGSAITATTGSAPNIPGWTLTFADEFNSTSLDKANYVRYWGKPSTAGAVSWWNGNSTLIVQNGLLRLKIAKETITKDGVTFPYTAGGFTQLTAQTYGRWVVRARFQKGEGTQGYISLWRQDFKWPPEIDFAELRGNIPNENIFTQHYLLDGKKKSEVSKLYETNYTDDFHEYTVIWEPGRLTWLVDGVQKFTTTQKFDAFPMVLAVGNLVGSCNSFAGCPLTTTPFPTYLDVDYIRIYKKA
ncbi:glycoside hydrolase family 16 protein [Trichocoleus sp. Lan]|uniref:glycoside hydrolase family 16 protein n=1 Tax=Trichocoleus sp. Lan TaxID=2933927 RepID=UPI003298A9EF